MLVRLRPLLALPLLFLAGIVAASDPFVVSIEVKEGLPLSQASVKGKYRNLLRTIHVPQDKETYHDFTDYGYFTGSEWQGHKNIPAGHWVYVYPRWYIWGEKVK